MKKIIAQIFRSLSWRFNLMANHLLPLQADASLAVMGSITPHTLWLKDKGDKTLRLDYPLLQDDVVIDVGGYEGQWASDIFSRYLCTIHIFEPVPDFALAIRNRFLFNKHIHVHQVGLGEIERDIEFSIAGDASSSIVTNEMLITARVVAFDAWYLHHKINEVALIKINIEGGEYELLEHLIESGLILKIKNIQVQFHDFFPEAEQRMHSIQSKLQKTHYLTYQYNFIWENWAIKDNV